MINLNSTFLLGIEIMIALIFFGEPTEERTISEMKEGVHMSMQANALFKVKSWDEKPFNEMKNSPKLTRAHVEKQYEGDINGEGILEYLMIHREDGTAQFVGLERITGSLEGRTGSFVLRHTGSFEHGVAEAKLAVVEDSGTGELAGIRGEGRFKSGHRQKYPVTLDYGFDNLGIKQE